MKDVLEISDAKLEAVDDAILSWKDEWKKDYKIISKPGDFIKIRKPTTFITRDRVLPNTNFDLLYTQMKMLQEVLDKAPVDVVKHSGLRPLVRWLRKVLKENGYEISEA